MDIENDGPRAPVDVQQIKAVRHYRRSKILPFGRDIYEYLCNAGTLTRYWVQTADSRVLLPKPKHLAWNEEEEEEEEEDDDDEAEEADEEQGRKLLWTLTPACLKVTMSHSSSCSW
ncbi:hypothetical protein BHYA_0273g00020 [Botrytis hyacinthi]|uniref:Uncharacterized protein n=1 Tax=Botrytis hyacinthi TaxID=278943 RepID=A0A4Z1GAE7_9HELO|nr:hypothetical protein BHYA_0273g00020 [Botrytis hyacinthi]